MIFSEKVFEKEFEDKVSKQAYLNLCKWLAVNVYGKVEFSKNITVKIEKQERKLPSFKLTLYVSIDEGEIEEGYCKKCMQLNSLLYSVEKPNCNTCKMAGYMKDKRKNIIGLVDFYKEAFKGK